jgi:hypothetical protein
LVSVAARPTSAAASSMRHESRSISAAVRSIVAIGVDKGVRELVK